MFRNVGTTFILEGVCVARYDLTEEQGVPYFCGTIHILFHRRVVGNGGSQKTLPIIAVRY